MSSIGITDSDSTTRYLWRGKGREGGGEECTALEFVGERIVGCAEERGFYFTYTLHIHFTYTLYIYTLHIHFTYTLHTLYVLEDLVAVLLEDGLKELLLLLRVRATAARALLDPRLEERAPLATFIRRDVEDTHAAHGGRSRVPAFCGEWGQD